MFQVAATHAQTLRMDGRRAWPQMNDIGVRRCLAAPFGASSNPRRCYAVAKGLRRLGGTKYEVPPGSSFCLLN